MSAIPDKKYELILSNPPFHTGRDVDYQVARAFIEQSYSALQTGGQLYLVANRFIRYEKIMDNVLPAVRCNCPIPPFSCIVRNKVISNLLLPGSTPSLPE